MVGQVTRKAPVLSAADHALYRENGYVVAPGLFTAAEVEGLREHYMRLRAAGSYPGDIAAVDTVAGDPLQQYPRMIHMHQWDDRSREFLLDARTAGIIAELLGNAPYAVQTMAYFKPPGARGQALHQDNYFISARPGNCIAAWLALDLSDCAAGCLRAVPGSHRWPLLCTEEADFTESFADVTVPVPEGEPIVDIEMEAGDVAFFHGSLVHGSLPNRTTDRFRRAVIAHYVDSVALSVSAHIAGAALRLDMSPAGLAVNEGGGPCGVWVDHQGRPVPELTGQQGGLGTPPPRPTG